MSRLEQLEQQIAELNLSELNAFRAWFERHDNEVWDRQIEADATAGKLDRLAEKALLDHAEGRTKPL